MRINDKFNELKKQGKKSLIVYLTAGFPDIMFTENFAVELEKTGVDMIEIGVPFSDPIADGPILQHTNQLSLEKGTNLKSIFSLCERLKARISIPYLLMSYYNPVYQFGIDNFAKECFQTGVSGIIIADLPFEESGPLKDSLKTYGIDLISFLTFTTSERRKEKILKKSSGFIYYISLAGVTGPREQLPERLMDDLKSLKEISHTPVAVGFGISYAAQVKEIKKYADGVIMGSFVMKEIIDNKIEELKKSLISFREELNGESK
ncbi:MAG: tryptophan synthase subunit alpha [Candidatus Omnitrophica bacterium]|nr:tryptophan synthase subunit alpha [Candidatus Omnitrophota bacterium]